MAKGLITRAYLEDTADAIRVLRGESDTYTPDVFGEKIIDAIPDVEVTDSIVSVTDAAAYPAEGLEFAIEPVQDLHGYDKPWPAGGGKNLLDKALLNNVDSTMRTITMQLLPNTQYTASTTLPLANGTANFFFHLPRSMESTEYNGVSNNISRTVTTGADGIVVVAYRRGVYTAEEWLTYNYQVELGSTATSYEPYANICPISGWTGVNGARTGVNVWDEQWERYSATQIKSKNLIKVNPNTNYYIKSSVMIGITYFNSEMEIINTEYKSNNTITIPSDAQYLSFITTTRYDSDTYNHDISINYPATDTEYHAYQGTSIPITFPALGKNKFDISKQTSYTSGSSSIVNNNDGTLTINLGGTTSIGNVKLKDLIGDELIGQTCFLSAQATGTSYYIYLFGENIAWGFNTSKTITKGMLDSTVLWYASGANTSATIYNIQLELGNQATAYEPYTNTVYGGKVDVENGKLTVDRKSVLLDGSSSTGFSFDGTYGTSSRFNYAGTNTDAKPAGAVISNYLRPQSVANDRECVSLHGATGTLIMLIHSDRLSAQTVDGFMSYLQSNPLHVVYELATPIEYDLTPQQVMMLLGNNNVWCDTGDTTLEYKVDLGRYIAKLQAAQTPQLSLSRQAVSLNAVRDEIAQSEDEAGDLR